MPLYIYKGILRYMEMKNHANMLEEVCQTVHAIVKISTTKYIKKKKRYKNSLRPSFKFSVILSSSLYIPIYFGVYIYFFIYNMKFHLKFLAFYKKKKKRKK